MYNFPHSTSRLTNGTHDSCSVSELIVHLLKHRNCLIMSNYKYARVSVIKSLVAVRVNTDNGDDKLDTRNRVR